MRKDVQDLILEQLTRLEEKVDKIATEKLPSILVDVSNLTQESSRSSRLYTLIGGAITVLLSIGTAVAVTLIKG